jgi:hypothetical protein
MIILYRCINNILQNIGTKTLVGWLMNLWDTQNDQVFSKQPNGLHILETSGNHLSVHLTLPAFEYLVNTFLGPTYCVKKE